MRTRITRNGKDTWSRHCTVSQQLLLIAFSLIGIVSTIKIISWLLLIIPCFFNLPHRLRLTVPLLLCVGKLYFQITLDKVFYKVPVSLHDILAVRQQQVYLRCSQGRIDVEFFPLAERLVLYIPKKLYEAQSDLNFQLTFGKPPYSPA